MRVVLGLGVLFILTIEVVGGITTATPPTEPYLTGLKPTINPHRVLVSLKSGSYTHLGNLIMDTENKTLDKPTSNDIPTELNKPYNSVGDYQISFIGTNKGMQCVFRDKNEISLVNVTLPIGNHSSVKGIVSSNLNRVYIIHQQSSGTADLTIVTLGEDMEILNSTISWDGTIGAINAVYEEELLVFAYAASCPTPSFYYRLRNESIDFILEVNDFRLNSDMVDWRIKQIIKVDHFTDQVECVNYSTLEKTSWNLEEQKVRFVSTDQTDLPRMTPFPTILVLMGILTTILVLGVRRKLIKS